MSARVTPYLSFAGDARAAMEFYNSVFGATGVMLMASDEDDPATAEGG